MAMDQFQCVLIAAGGSPTDPDAHTLFVVSRRCDVVIHAWCRTALCADSHHPSRAIGEARHRRLQSTSQAREAVVESRRVAECAAALVAHALFATHDLQARRLLRLPNLSTCTFDVR
eukprot:5414315-Prymnesium_polylepis.2